MEAEAQRLFLYPRKTVDIEIICCEYNEEVPIDHSIHRENAVDRSFKVVRFRPISTGNLFPIDVH